jgi:hypothetical protein
MDVVSGSLSFRKNTLKGKHEHVLVVVSRRIRSLEALDQYLATRRHIPLQACHQAIGRDFHCRLMDPSNYFVLKKRPFVEPVFRIMPNVKSLHVWCSIDTCTTKGRLLSTIVIAVRVL